MGSAWIKLCWNSNGRTRGGLIAEDMNGTCSIRQVSSPNLLLSGGSTMEQVDNQPERWHHIISQDGNDWPQLNDSAKVSSYRLKWPSWFGGFVTNKHKGDESPLAAQFALIFGTSSQTSSELVKTSFWRITRLIWLGQLVLFHYEVYCLV